MISKNNLDLFRGYSIADLTALELLLLRLKEQIGLNKAQSTQLSSVKILISNFTK